MLPFAILCAIPYAPLSELTLAKEVNLLSYMQ